MSVAAHAALPAAPHPEPPTAATGARPRGGGQTVKVPLRLVVGAQYADAALSVYVKTAALAVRTEGCTAKVSTIAAYLGVSKSAVERALRQLTLPDPIDGLVEVPSRRRTYKDGRGQSAERHTRPLTAGELWVRIPVRAAEALTPRLLRLYALLAYATARRIPVTVAELGEQLHHHSGGKAGLHLSERQVRRLVDELEATGWLTVHRREGERGRHAYETSTRPLHAVPATDPTVATAPEDQEQGVVGAPVIHDGSGPGDHDGSLASKEDLQTDRRIKTQVVGGIRRRRGTGSTPRGPVDNSVPDTFGRGGRVLRTDPETPPSAVPGSPYTGPALQISPRVWRVLEPVRHELPAVRTYLLRKIARAIGSQLDAGGACGLDSCKAGTNWETGEACGTCMAGARAREERLTDRLTRRYARTTPVRDIGRWILGAGLPRRGCGLEGCESGTQWETGEACETCMANARARQARALLEAELAVRERQMAADRHTRAHGLARPEQDEDQAVAADPTPPPLYPVPLPDEPPAQPLPAPATAAERAAATPDQIRTAITEHGRFAAIHQYGHALVLPHLAAMDLPETGS